MKSMKKMLSLLLVALLLVSAVPMFASAQAVEGEFDVPSDGGSSEVFEQLPQQSEKAQTTLSDGPVTLEDPDEDDSGDNTSITVNAVLITRNAETGGTSRTRTVQVPYSPSATLGDVLLNARGLNQSARTNGIAEYSMYDYKIVPQDDSASFNELNHYDDAEASEGDTVGSLAVDGRVYVQFYRTRKTVNVTLSLDGSNHGDYVKKNVPLYSTLNLPSAFSAAKLAPNAGYYIAYYEDALHTDRGPIGSPSSYLITEPTTIVGYQDLTANKPINNGSVDTSGGSNTTNSSGNVGSDGAVGSNNGSSGSGSNTSGSNKFQHVYLNIYKDTKVGSADKRVEITKGIAVDKWVNMAEVKNVVKTYYSAKDSNGIEYDGLYLDGNWASDYVADQNYDTIDLTKSTDDNVFINVMISNATTKSSSVADSSNPKTGDTIFAPIAVLGISASALAVVMYFYSKKCMAR